MSTPRYGLLRHELGDRVTTTVTNCHSNDPGFVEAALMAFDGWLAGLVRR